VALICISEDTLNDTVAYRCVRTLHSPTQHGQLDIATMSSPVMW